MKGTYPTPHARTEKGLSSDHDFKVINLFYRGGGVWVLLLLEGGGWGRASIPKKTQYTTESRPSSVRQRNAIKMAFR